MQPPYIVKEGREKETLSGTRFYHLIMALPKFLCQGLIGREIGSSLNQSLGQQARLRAPGRVKLVLGEV